MRKEPIGSDRRPCSGAVDAAAFSGCRTGDELGQRAEKVAGLNVDRGAEEAAQLGLDRVGFGQGVEPGVALGRNERQGFVEPATDDRPFIGEKLEIGHAIQSDAQTGVWHPFTRSALKQDPVIHMRSCLS